MQLSDAESKLAQIFQPDEKFDDLFTLDMNIQSVEEAMSVIYKLKTGLANVLSENRKLDGEIIDLKTKIDELT